MRARWAGGRETARPSRLAPPPCHDFERERGAKECWAADAEDDAGAAAGVEVRVAPFLDLFVSFSAFRFMISLSCSPTILRPAFPFQHQHVEASTCLVTQSVNPAIPSPSLFHPPPCLGLWEEGGACAAAMSQSLVGGGCRRRCLVSAFADQGGTA